MNSNKTGKHISLKDYTVVFWDFDGVIKESTDVKTEGFRKLFAEYGWEIQKQVVHHHELNAGISRFVKIPYYFKTFLSRDLTKDEITAYCIQYGMLTNEAVVNAEWVPGVKQYLSSYRHKQDFFIVTGTPQNDIDWIIDHIGIKDYFRGIFGSPRTKSEILSAFFQKGTHSREQCIMIGDSVADYQAATESHIDFLLRATPGNRQTFKEIYCPSILDFKEML